MVDDNVDGGMSQIINTGRIWEDDKLVGDENGIFENVRPVVASKKTESRTLHLYKLKCEQYRELRKMYKNLHSLHEDADKYYQDRMNKIEEESYILKIDNRDLKEALDLAKAKIELLLATHGEKSTVKRRL